MNPSHRILGAMKFKVHLQNFSKVSTRAGCGGTIYLGITREASHIFCGLILSLQGIFYSLLTSFFLKGGNTEPILTVKRIEWMKFIDYFGLSIEADPSRVGKKNVCIFPYWVYTSDGNS